MYLGMHAHPYIHIYIYMYSFTLTLYIYVTVKVKESTDLKESKIEEGYHRRFLREKRDKVNNIIKV